MSLNLKQNVKCPKCSQMSEVTVWNSITVKDSEDLKHDLLTGKVNMFRCPSCSYSALMPTPMLYHDEDKRLMISFSPCDEYPGISQGSGVTKLSTGAPFCIP